MIYPNYKENNIVNLSSSILVSFGIESLYTPIKELDDLRKYKNIILIVIDGLGYNCLREFGDGSLLQRNTVMMLTSVFPSSTASALTTLETGVAPQQHGITGWYMLLKELGLVAKILPFRPRYGGEIFSNSKVSKNRIYTEKTIADKIRPRSFIVYPEKIAGGKVSQKRNYILPYKSFNNMLSCIKEAISHSDRKKYIYAYWDKYDALCHKEGCSGKMPTEHLRELNGKLESFIRSLKGTDSTVLITADHGVIDTRDSSKIVYLNNYPELYNALTLPLCGEPRAAYCYVRQGRGEDFEKNIINRLGFCCDVYKSEELIRQGYFGLFEPNKLLSERVGDYTLIMKENYILKDRLLNEKEHMTIGNHGGISDEEIYVPLIWIKDI